MGPMEFAGTSLQARGSRTYTLTGELTDAGARMLGAFDVPWREVVITLGVGQVWPKHVKRGQWMSMTVMGHLMEGRVRHRRLNRLVLDAHFIG